MKRNHLPLILVTAALVGFSHLPVARAETGDKPAAAAKSSEVEFPISCSAAAQKKFNQAVWILHSFWYEEAVKAFTAVTEAEPDCAMGYWGIAMSHWYPLWYPPNAAALKAGSEAVEKAVAAKQKTDREGDYIAAIAAFYRDNDKVDHRTRAVAYEKAMEQVHLRYPDDREGGVFYSLALVATAPPTDKTYANQKKARAILEAVRAELPNHPGVAHYLIHANDSAEMAEDGLTAALCYADIAPAVPHALHMPSHIFTRLGMWRQSVDANRAATAAGLAYVREELGPDAFNGEAVHSMDYMEYAYLQMGQDRDAKRVVDELLTFRRANRAEPADGLCHRGNAGALCGRTPELAGGRRPHRAADAVSLGALPMGGGDDLVHAGAGCGSYRGHGGRRGRNRQASILEAEARSGQG